MAKMIARLIGDRKEPFIFLAASVVAVLIYYGSFLNNYYVLDDYTLINQLNQGPSHIIFGGNDSLRVITNIQWWLLYSISGFDRPYVFQLFVLAFHCGSAILLYLFLLRLFNDKGYAVLGGAFFLLNASSADAILVKGSNICSLFYLAALYNYVIYRQRGLKANYALSAALFLLAMFTKEDAASLPFIIVLIELVFFDGMRHKMAVAKKTTPYAAVILLYVLMTKVVFLYLLGGGQPWSANPFSIRPLYSLFGGFTVFFLHPDGSLRMPITSNPYIYLTALGVVISFFWVKDKRALFFGYGWIFLTFLPQSLSKIGQFNGELLLYQSISRYLYIPSAGSAIVLAAIVVRFREKVPRKAYYAAAAVFLLAFIGLNYGRVQDRGKEWRDRAEPESRFLPALKSIMPSFPPNSHIFVVNGPEGRSRLAMAVRAFFRQPDIAYIYGAENYIRQPADNAFLILCDWDDQGQVAVQVFPIISQIPRQFTDAAP